MIKNDAFIFICKSIKIDLPVKEYRFCKDRRWRIDYCWPDLRLAIEIEGGCWIKGRHLRPLGFIKDMEKYNRLVEEGWLLLRYQPDKIDWDQIKRVYYFLKSVND